MSEPRNLVFQVHTIGVGPTQGTMTVTLVEVNTTPVTQNSNAFVAYPSPGATGGQLTTYISSSSEDAASYLPGKLFDLTLSPRTED